MVTLKNKPLAEKQEIKQITIPGIEEEILKAELRNLKKKYENLKRK